MPLVTAGFGLITGVALIGLATHVTSMSNVAPELALMIGLGVGIDYALFIVTRFRESYSASRRHRAVGARGDGHLGAGDPARGHDRRDRAARDVRDRRHFLYGLSIASVLAVLLTMISSLTVLPALLSRFGAAACPAGAPGTGARSRRPGRRASRCGGAGA